jgi:hypothetical protein
MQWWVSSIVGSRVPDTFLRLVPRDPTCVPPATARERAQEILRQAVLNADDLAWQVSREVRFVDCGGNFETVTCPGCGRDLGEWWSAAMEAGHEQQFRDLRATTPCCGLRTTLNDLTYSMPAGFGRCVLEVQNPTIDSLPEQARRSVERSLGCPVRVIWAHY